MKFGFRELPDASGGLLTPRPLIDVWLEGIEVTALAGLVDTGALRTRFSRELAELGGIDLADAATERVAIGGISTLAAAAPVRLSVRQGTEAHDWEATVWFCDPWPFPFQLLGLDGFLRHFRVNFSAYHEWLDCRPER